MTMRAGAACAVPATGERTLIQRARDMEAEAWNELYSTHHPAIFRYVYLRTGDRTIADDLTAEVFVRAVDGIRRYRQRGVAFRAWLYRIAHHVTVDHHRETRRTQAEPITDKAADVSDDGDLAGHVVDRRTLQAALDRLTAEQQQVVVLRFVEGLSLAEVAQATGRRPGAVKSMQFHALQRMRTMLEEGD